MSTNVEFLIWAHSGQARDVYMDLVQRMLERGTAHTVNVDERRVGKTHETQLDVTPTPDVMRALLSSTIHEYGELVVRVAYRTRSAGVVPTAMTIFGDKSLSGSPDMGTFAVTTDLSSLMEPFWAARGDRRFTIEQAEKVLEDVSFGAQLVELRHGMEIVSRDMEEMFLRTCDLLSDVDTGVIKHGAVYVSNLWASPLTSCMTYHRDAAEFARDFARIYLHARNFNIMSDLTFQRKALDIWLLEIEFAANPTPSIGDQDYLVGVYHPSPAPKAKDAPVLKLRHQLDRAHAEKLTSLSASEIRPLLAQAVEEIPYTWMNDFGDRGIVIGTRPISNFRNLYPRIAELAGVIKLA